MNRSQFLSRFLLNTPKYQQPIAQSQQRHSKAAVLIILVERASGLHIVLTERALHLRHHPGQISFPGGKQEPFDASLLRTALRETEEEIGITPSLLEVFGQLPPLYTSSGFQVFPFIAFADHRFRLHIDVQEVRSVFELPLNFLLNDNNVYLQHLIANKKRHFTYCIPFQNHLIWGATAQMLKNLQCILLPKCETEHSFWAQ